MFQQVRAAMTAAVFILFPAGSAVAAVTPGGTIADKITVVAGFAGETLSAAAGAGDFGTELIHEFDTEIGTTDPTYELTGFGAVALSSGRHLVLYNAEFLDGSNGNRSEVQTRLDLDLVPLAIGRSQGYTRSNGNVDETITTGAAIITVENDDDLLDLVSYRSDRNGAQTLTRVDGATAMQVLKLDDSWDFLSLRKSATGTSAVGVTPVGVTYDAPVVNTGTAFSYAGGAGAITVNSAGLYLVCANTGLEKPNNGTRTQFRQYLALDGVEVPGSRVTTYMRGNQNSEAANSGMTSVASIVNVGAGQALSVQVAKAVGDDSPIQGGMTALTIVKLPPTAKYLSLLDTSEQPINDVTADPVVFGTQVSPGNSEFSFTPGGSAVTVNTDSDYLFLGSLYTADDATAENADRVLVRTGWQVDGAGGLLAYGQGAEYMRDTDGAHEAGQWCGAILDLAATQTVQLMTELAGNTDPAEGDVMGLLALSIESLKPSPDPSIFINNPLRTNPGLTSTITDALLLTFDGNTPDSGLTYTVDSAPAGGTLRHTANGVLGLGGTFTQDDIVNKRIEFEAGPAPATGGFDFTVSDGGASDSSSFAVEITWPESVVTITADGDVMEGATAGWTLNATLAPSDSPLTVGIVYSGSAAAGDDFTAVATVEIPVGATTVDLEVPTVADAVAEGCELIVATIGSMSGGNLSPVPGDPSRGVVGLIEGNSAPDGDLSVTFVGAGTVGMNILSVADANADYESSIATTGPPLYQFSGPGNGAVFADGRAEEDFAFDLDLTGSALSETAGLSIELEFTARAADLTGTVLLFEIGGTSNGTSIHLVDGVPHLLGKAGGAAGNTPVDTDANPANGFEDLDWGGNAIVVPLSTNPVAVGTPTRLAVIYDIVAGTVSYSMNGAATGSATLTGNDSNNWLGDHTVANGQINGGIGGTSSTAGNTFTEANVKNLAGGFGAVTCVRFWNEVNGAITATAGDLEEVTVTLTIDGWGSDSGSITAVSGNGESYANGVWTVTGGVPTVNAALSNAIYIPGVGAADPAVILVAVEDGNEDGGGPTSGAVIISSTAPDPVYVDDDFTVAPGSPIADADLGAAGSQSAIMAFDAFANLADAVAASAVGGTIIVNDGDYGAENIALVDGQVFRLADTTGGVTIGDLAALKTSTIDLQGNTLTVGNDTTGAGIDCAISGTGGITKNGTGRVIFREVCTYTGTTTVNDGWLRVGFRNADGLQSQLSGNGPVVVNSPGRLEFNVDVDKTLTQTGVISGDGSVGTLGDGTVVFNANGPNPFTGGFELGDGATSSWDGASGNKNGFVVVNDSGHLGTGNILSRGSQLQAGVPGIVIANDIDITGGGFRVGGVNDTEFSGQVNPIDDAARGFGNYGLEGLDLTVSGNINLDGGAMIPEGSNGKDNGTWTFTGDISGAGNLTVQNSFDDGVVTFTGTHTYTGATEFRAGTTYYNATHTGGLSWLVNGGTLGGTGSTDVLVTVDANSTFSPGDDTTPIATFGTGGLYLSGSLVIDVDNTSGNGHDQVTSTGLVDILGVLVVNEGGLEATPAGVVVVDNNSGDTVVLAATNLGPAGEFSSDYMGSGKLGIAIATGGDGDDLSLTVGADTALGLWRLANFGSVLNSGNGANDSDAGDLDTIVNLLEFGFGTDPNALSLDPVALDGTAAGLPAVDGTGGPALVWVQRTDAGEFGSVTYTPQFSPDLQGFTDDLAAPTVVGAIDADYEVVSLSFPLGAEFGRIVVELVE
jgi:autotransporter-associated beta strand protein